MEHLFLDKISLIPKGYKYVILSYNSARIVCKAYWLRLAPSGSGASIAKYFTTFLKIATKSKKWEWGLAPSSAVITNSRKTNVSFKWKTIALFR